MTMEPMNPKGWQLLLGQLADAAKNIDFFDGTTHPDDTSAGNRKSVVFGWDENDILRGGNGVDVLIGNAGDDRICGGNSNDYLRGDAGNDLMNGGRGSDFIASMYGSDTVWTGKGRGQDTVVLTANQAHMERVTGASGDDFTIIKDWDQNDTFIFKGGARRFDTMLIEDTAEGVLVTTGDANRIVLFEGVHDVAAVEATLETGNPDLTDIAFDWLNLG